MATSVVLAGRYELLSRIGRGGMGEVWRAKDRVMNRAVAVKHVPYNGDADTAAQFQREASTAAAVNHRGVVTVHDLGFDKPQRCLYLVMELIEGQDLATVLRKDGRPTVPEAMEWSAQAAEALTAAHKAKIVHRDLKPSNLMLSPEGRVVILDFGIARFIESTQKSTNIRGTIRYMPPERLKGDQTDPRSDLYSLGCVLYELLTGHVPFRGFSDVPAIMNAHMNEAPEKPSNYNSDIPGKVDELVLALMAKDPEKRPSCAAMVSASLRALLAEPTPAPTARLAEAPSPPDAGRRLPPTPPPIPLPGAPLTYADVTAPQPPHAGATRRRPSAPISAPWPSPAAGARRGRGRPPCCPSTSSPRQRRLPGSEKTGRRTPCASHPQRRDAKEEPASLCIHPRGGRQQRSRLERCPPFP